MLAWDGCWQHHEPCSLPVQSHTSTCQGHICRAALVPLSVNRVMAFGWLGSAGGSEIWGHLPLFLSQGVFAEVQGDSCCLIIPLCSLPQGKNLLFYYLVITSASWRLVSGSVSSCCCYGEATGGEGVLRLPRKDAWMAWGELRPAWGQQG